MLFLLFYISHYCSCFLIWFCCSFLLVWGFFLYFTGWWWIHFMVFLKNLLISDQGQVWKIKWYFFVQHGCISIGFFTSSYLHVNKVFVPMENYFWLTTIYFMLVVLFFGKSTPVHLCQKCTDASLAESHWCIFVRNTSVYLWNKCTNESLSETHWCSFFV